MLIPVRCWSCGKPVAHLWEKFNGRVANGEEPRKVLDDLGLKRYCCRALFLGHIDLINITAKYKRD